MSSAFVRDQDVDHLEMPERPVSPDPNDVTESGLAQIEDVLAKASEAYDISRASADRSAFAAAERDLRYWTARRATARVVSASADTAEVRFGASVTILRDDGREQTFRIVGEDEADPAKGSISHVSPLARSMFGKCVGDVVRAGSGKAEIKAISQGLAPPRTYNSPNRTEKVMMPDYPKPPFPSQSQEMPGSTDAMQPPPDHGEKTYKGCGRLKGLKAVITGGDSGIGRAVAIAYAREGADVLIAFLDETEDAKEVKKLVENEGRKAILISGDLRDARHCREVIKRAVDDLGGIDILVNNAAHQATFKDIGDISDEEWEMTFQTNVHAMFYLTKAAVPHMKPGSAIINTTSINSDMPNPILLAYATTKGAVQNFTGGLAQMLAEKGIRANAVAPGPIWTPLIPSTMPEDAVKNFGKQVPMKRPGQPAELATTYVMLADPMSSYVSGTTVAVTGGKPFI